MRRWLGALTVLACAASGCGPSTGAPAATSPVPRISASPTRPTGTILRPSATAISTPTPIPVPLPLYSQQLVAKGTYQLINNATEQFVSVTASGVRTICPSGARASCARYLMIGVTEYSGNTSVAVSPRQFKLESRAGVRYAPAPAGQAARVVPPSALLPTTVLQPDDDGDFASGTVVFLVPRGAGRFSLLWRGHHVATFATTARGKLYETR
ncbi:MAG: hypothetical protein JOZ41_09695 [Chloroflexi bacterium]|nr:hypothetical protein [Chloroflexota bacterium]